MNYLRDYSMDSLKHPLSSPKKKDLANIIQTLVGLEANYLSTGTIKRLTKSQLQNTFVTGRRCGKTLSSLASVIAHYQHLCHVSHLPKFLTVQTVSSLHVDQSLLKNQKRVPLIKSCPILNIT